MVIGNPWMASLGILALAGPAVPCSVVGPLPTPQALVERATLIVHARVEGMTHETGVSESVLTQTPTQVRFLIVDVLKGRLAGSELRVNGRLDQENDWNDRPVPYDFVRPGGRHGNCFALAYKQGSEYLLLLNETQSKTGDSPIWTPYWAALSPTNEQVRGVGDPWLAWVVRQIKRKPGA